MKFNILKCKIMHVGRNNPRYEYYMEGVRLTVVEEEKDIGVKFEKSMKSSKHCKQAAGIDSFICPKATRQKFPL